jgi:two-component system CheB/CheR fusion protein
MSDTNTNTNLPPAQPPSLVLLMAVSAEDETSFAAALARLRPTANLALLVMPITEQDGEACARRLRHAAGPFATVTASDDLAVLPDRIHLVPPGMVAELQDGRLALRPGAEGMTPLEDALAALGRSHGDRAIALVFAGTANHSYNGVAAFKEGGGLLLAEGMEDAAAVPEAGLMADHLLPVGDLMERLYEHVDYRSQLSASLLPRPEELARIVALVGTQTGVDFSDYKKSTLQRRIQRRVGINRLDDVAAYIELLQRSPAEAIILYRDMLIGVTRFFRDPEAFAALAEAVIRPLASPARRREPVRIWIAGCATGEEAYSIAILMREAIAASGSDLAVKIFATDLDREAVQFASQGAYPLGIAGDVSAERLERHFIRKGDAYQICKPVREMVVFAHHNIARDPPFFRMDLVTCRNLLIYLQPVLQRRLFSSFHFALRPDGHLMLGTSETLGEMASYFSAVDAKWKIYQKRGDRLPRISENLVHHRPIRQRGGDALGNPGIATEGLHDLIQQTLLNEMMPAFLIADGDFEIRYLSGTVERYLSMPRGRPSFNLVKMASRELAVAFSTGIRRALRDGVPVVFDEIVTGDGLAVRLVIRPLTKREGLGDLAVVIFEEPARGAAGGKPFDISAQTDQRINDLELELEQSKESLQAAIEELETSNEELQATNEEVLASNEELQSTNEELQSVNEELYTVNAEHQAKITELTELNNDILNLLGAANIGTVFLDQRLCVRKFTHAATEQINLIDKDIGRPLAHISNNIEYAHVVQDAEEVLRTLVPKSRKVCTRAGRWYLMRMLPYRTEDNVIKGVIITFIDIAETQVAGEQIRRLANVVENSALMAMITGASGDIEYVNQRFVEVTGWPAEAVVGRHPRLLTRAGHEPVDPTATMGEALAWQGTCLNQTRDGTPFAEEAVVVALPMEEGSRPSYLKLARVIPG